MNPFLRQPAAFQRTPLRAERPSTKTVESGVVSLRLYDPLDSWGGMWGVSAKEFAAVLDELPDDTSEIRLLINSPGGEVWEGLAVLNALRAHPAKVVAVVEGIAASSASFVAAGVDELHVMKNAEIFVHNAWGICLGNAADMQKMAADLTHEDRNIASIYADKAGGTVEDWLATMATETFYSAEEAVEAGLADRVIDPSGDGAAAAKARFDLSIFNHAGRPNARVSARTKTPAGGGSSQQEGSPAVAFSDEQLTTMRQQLGVADDADETAILAALTDRLAAPPEPPHPAPLPEGVVAIDAAQLEVLQAAARRGDEARARQERDDRESLVTAAINDGRIPPARRDHWLAQLAADPGAKDVLASLAPGLVPVGAPIGHVGAPDTEADALYAAVFGEES